MIKIVKNQGEFIEKNFLKKTTVPAKERSEEYFPPAVKGFFRTKFNQNI